MSSQSQLHHIMLHFDSRIDRHGVMRSTGSRIEAETVISSEVRDEGRQGSLSQYKGREK